MKKKYKETKTDEIFQSQKNKYHHLINKNHIYNNIYINLDVYQKWRNLNIDKDENKHWNEKSLNMVLNVDSNLMDKNVKNLLRRGVSDSLKHLIWIRSNDVNYFVINFPNFYETTIYNTFGDKIPSNLSNDCPTFCGGILGLQEDIMCVQTKIEELEIEHNDDYNNFNINDSTSNILQLLFNNPSENKKDSDKYLLPEHNFWLEPKTLSSPNFGFSNKKKKKNFLYIENVKNKILKNKKIDNYLRVSSDSILPYSSNFLMKNISNSCINNNDNNYLCDKDKNKENINTFVNNNSNNNCTENNYKMSSCSMNDKNILIKDDIIIFHNVNDKQNDSINLNYKANNNNTQNDLFLINKEISESSKYLHIQYYMNEQYIISKKQAEKMSKAKLYLRTRRKKKAIKQKDSIKTKSFDESYTSISELNSDNSLSSYFNERTLNDEMENFCLNKNNSYSRTKSFFKKTFSTKRTYKKNERKLSDHISLLLRENLNTDIKEKNIISSMDVDNSLMEKGIKCNKENKKNTEQEQEKKKDKKKDIYKEINRINSGEKCKNSCKHITVTKMDRKVEDNEKYEEKKEGIIKLSAFNSKENQENDHGSIDFDGSEICNLKNNEKKNKKSIFGKIKNIFYKRKKSKHDNVSLIKCRSNQENTYIEKKEMIKKDNDLIKSIIVNKTIEIKKKNDSDDAKRKCIEKDKTKNYDTCISDLKKKKMENDINEQNYLKSNIHYSTFNLSRDNYDYNTANDSNNKNSDNNDVSSNDDDDNNINCNNYIINNNNATLTKNCNKYNIVISNHENDSNHSIALNSLYNKKSSCINNEEEFIKMSNKSFLSKNGKIKNTISHNKSKKIKFNEKDDNDSNINDLTTLNEYTNSNLLDEEDNFYAEYEELESYSSYIKKNDNGKDQGVQKEKLNEFYIKKKEEKADEMEKKEDNILNYSYNTAYDNDLENFELPSSHPLNEEKKKKTKKKKKKINFKDEYEEGKGEYDMSGKENEKINKNREIDEKKKKKKEMVFYYYRDDINKEEKEDEIMELKGECEEEKIRNREEKNEKENGEEQEDELNRKIKKSNFSYSSKENQNSEKELYNKFYENNNNNNTYPNVYNLDDATELTALLNDDGKHEIKKLLWAINNNFGNDVEFAPIIPNLCIILLIYFKASVVYCIIHCLIKKGIDSVKNKEPPFFVYKRKDFVKYVKYILNSFIQFLPKCYYYLRKLNFDLAAWTARCIQDGFSRMLPFDFVLRIYGTFLFEGQKTLCLYCLALLKFLENDILKCTNIEEVENILYHICMHPYLNINDLTQIAYKFKLKSKEKHLKFSTKCPSPYLMNVKIKTFYRPRLNDNSRLINSFHWENIWEKIPSNIRSLDPFLAFCSKKDGYNLQILLEKTEKNKKKPMILILKTFDYDLIGFFCPFSLNRDYNFFKDSDKSSAFLCTFNSTFKFYKWSGKNNTLVLIKDGIYIGGNDIALFIDKDIKYGKTNPSESFLSPSLISNGYDFQIMDIEIWNLK
ncbi:rab GTPase activator, putative [Plasmodium relictum]|uniref:Rab GTPase activator, putative n=1 Tax=Plasmodium relictum TaxID=85471 RepID=A0A1J1H9E0_PLARL|nr:rab GTPase activator, putative [Plasmodium relictum]CRH01245.1 rab GTPase activator, putative [Plasmodium relictum]